jgi:hypothetical protein
VNKPQENIVLINAAGLDLYTPSLAKTNEIFFKDGDTTKPDTDKIKNTVTETYRQIMKAARHFELNALSMLGMGMGVFLLSITGDARRQIHEEYIKIQIREFVNAFGKDEDKDRDYWLNPANAFPDIYSAINKLNSEDGINLEITKPKEADINNIIGNYPESDPIDVYTSEDNRCVIYKITNTKLRLIIHKKDSIHLAQVLASQGNIVGLLNPSDAVVVCLGLPGYYAMKGRYEGFVVEEWFGMTSSMLLSYTSILEKYYKDNNKDKQELDWKNDLSSRIKN